MAATAAELLRLDSSPSTIRCMFFSSSIDSFVGLLISVPLASVPLLFPVLSVEASKLVGEQDRLERGLLRSESPPLWWLLVDRVGEAQSENVPLFSRIFFASPSEESPGLCSLSSVLAFGGCCPLYVNGRMPYGKNRCPNAELGVTVDRLLLALKR